MKITVFYMQCVAYTRLGLRVRFVVFVHFRVLCIMSRSIDIHFLG